MPADATGAGGQHERDRAVAGCSHARPSSSRSYAGPLILPARAAATGADRPSGPAAPPAAARRAGRRSRRSTPNTITATTPDSMPCRDRRPRRRGSPAAAAGPRYRRRRPRLPRSRRTSARARHAAQRARGRRGGAIMTMSTAASTVMPTLLAASSAVTRSGRRARDRQHDRRDRDGAPAGKRGDRGVPVLAARVQRPRVQREQAVADEAGRERDDRGGERRRSGRVWLASRRTTGPSVRRRRSCRPRRAPRAAARCGSPRPTYGGKRRFVAGRVRRGQGRVDRCRDRQREHRPRHQVDGLGEGEDEDEAVRRSLFARRVASASVSCCATTVTTPTAASPRHARAGLAVEAYGRPPSQPQRAHRNDQARATARRRRASCRSARISCPRRADLGNRGHGGSASAVHDVGGDHHDAGQQRGQHRPREAPMALEQAAEHDADAVQRDLRGEDPQHPRPDGDRRRTVAADGTEQHRHDRLGEHRDEHARAVRG